MAYYANTTCAAAASGDNNRNKKLSGESQYGYYDVRDLLEHSGATLPVNPRAQSAKQADKTAYIYMESLVASVCVCLNAIESIKCQFSTQMKCLSDKLASLTSAIQETQASIERQQYRAKFAHADDEYVKLADVVSFSGYCDKRTKQLMLPAIAKGEIQTEQHKLPNGHLSHVRYLWGDVVNFWEPRRRPLTKAQRNARKYTV